MTNLRAVIIGGGAAGTCLSRTLSARGINVIMLERSNMLCAGATWHAAGLVTRFAGNSKLKKVHLRSLEILNELHDKYNIGLNITGSIRVITKGDNARMEEVHAHNEMAALYDNPLYPTKILSPEECKALHPLIEENMIECGLYTPQDGDIDPTLMTTQIGNLAKANGSTHLLNTEVLSIEHSKTKGVLGQNFLVKTVGKDPLTGLRVEDDKKEFEADFVVNAAGLWSKGISKLVSEGLRHPITNHSAFIIEHQYIISEAIPEIKKLDYRLPCLRHMESSSYIRQEGKGLLIGPYEKKCRVKNQIDERGNWKLGPPKDWALNELFPDNVEAIEDNLMTSIELVPPLGNVGFKSCVNGPTIWTGDSLARCGRTEIPNYYDFNSLTYGIAQSPALSEYLTSIILDGEQTFEASGSFDPLRYGSWANEKYTHDTICETYAKNNAPSYPHENRKQGREHVLDYQSPLHKVLLEQGARTTFSLSGVESPAWFEGPSSCSPGSKVENEMTFSKHQWEDIVKKEAAHVSQHVGIQNASFSKISVKGENARDFLMWATTGIIPKDIGSCRLTYALTPSGKVISEFSVTKVSEDEYYLVGSRDYADIDVAWFNVDLPAYRKRNGMEPINGVIVKNISDEIDILHVAGPKSKELLCELNTEIEDIPFLKWREMMIAGHNIKVFRVSFSGFAGYEFHCPRHTVVDVYRSIKTLPNATKLNLKDFGGYALNSLRIEKAYKIRPDLDYVHYSEAGIQPFVSNKKSMGFVGKNPSYKALKTSSIFEIKTKPGYQFSVAGDTPIRQGDKIVGYTATSSFGVVCQKTIALGYLLNEHFNAKNDSQNLTINVYGEIYNVNVLSEPPVAMTGRENTPKPQVVING